MEIEMRIIAEIADTFDGRNLWVAIDDSTFDGDIQGVGFTIEEAIEDLMEQLEGRM